jgi:hypothetical protein
MHNPHRDAAVITVIDGEIQFLLSEAQIRGLENCGSDEAVASIRGTVEAAMDEGFGHIYKISVGFYPRGSDPQWDGFRYIRTVVDSEKAKEAEDDGEEYENSVEEGECRENWRPDTDFEAEVESAFSDAVNEAIAMAAWME